MTEEGRRHLEARARKDLALKLQKWCAVQEPVNFDALGKDRPHWDPLVHCSANVLPRSPWGRIGFHYELTKKPILFSSFLTNPNRATHELEPILTNAGEAYGDLEGILPVAIFEVNSVYYSYSACFNPESERPILRTKSHNRQRYVHTLRDFLDAMTLTPDSTCDY